MNEKIPIGGEIETKKSVEGKQESDKTAKELRSEKLNQSVADIQKLQAEIAIEQDETEKQKKLEKLNEEWLLFADQLLESSDDEIDYMHGEMIQLEINLKQIKDKNSNRAKEIQERIKILQTLLEEHFNNTYPHIEVVSRDTGYYVNSIILNGTVADFEELAQSNDGRFLKKIKTSKNNWQDVITSEDIQKITSLDLWDNEIEEAGARAIAGSETLGSLTSLDLRYNNIGDAGARAIAGSETLGSLTSLNLKQNNIGEAGARAIAGSETLGSLTSLDLWNNNIGEAGARAIAGSETLGSLTSLDLRYNNIGDAGARAIAGSETLGSLTSLDLDGNNIGDAGARAIAGSETLGSLTSLDLDGNNIEEEVKAELKPIFLVKGVDVCW